MSVASDKIRNLRAFPFEQYSGISSREKLVVFTIKYLSDNNIKTSFDYVCVAAFRFFPEEFKLSNEFPDIPDIAGLNRTLMHLRPSERNFATGKPNTFYELTESGKALANQVAEGLEKGLFVTRKNVSRHDEVVEKANLKDYIDFINNHYYKQYLIDKNYSLPLIWNIFEVIPFTNLDSILLKIKCIIDISKSKNDNDSLDLAQRIYEDIKILIEKKKLLEKGVN